VVLNEREMAQAGVVYNYLFGCCRAVMAAERFDSSRSHGGWDKDRLAAKEQSAGIFAAVCG